MRGWFGTKGPLALLFLGLAACATGPRDEPVSLSADRRASASSATDPALLARFAPRPRTTTTIDYALIDEALDLMVFNSGPSLRQRGRFPEPLVGSRLVKGHTSPYRMEGNKVFFSVFDDAARRALSDYRASLEGIAATDRVQALPRNEQLAFWFNLHNLVVLDELTQAYPVRVPSAVRPVRGGPALHDAPIIDLGDDVVSLRDVREIVYAHWSDPKVIYGFFHGDLGGPSIRSEAYTGEDVSGNLDRQAREFVNSLRGVLGRGERLYVSEVYGEARPHYFADWPDDLLAHLGAFADEQVAADVAEATEVRTGQYEDRIADMAGGDAASDLGFGYSIALPGSRAALEDNFVERTGAMIPQSMARLAREYEDKIEELRRRGYLKPKVIIIDVPTDDPADAEVE